MALDRDLVTLIRAWCVAEVRKTLDKGKPIRYLYMGEETEIARRFFGGEFEQKSVSECSASE